MRRHARAAGSSLMRVSRLTLLQASAIPHVHRAVCKYRILDPLCNERDPVFLRPSPKRAHCLVE